MRRIIISLIVLLISIWVGVKIAQDPGYFLVTYRHTSIEMPLWAAVVSLFLLFWGFYFALRLWHWFRHVPRHIRVRLEKGHKKKLQKFSSQGLLDLTTGNWLSAQKKLIKATSYAPTPWPYYLAASYAAHKLKNDKMRDNYLRKASDSSRETKIAIGLMKAQFQLEHHPVQAIAILEHLRQLAPKQPYTLRLLAKAYEQLDDWNNVLILLPALRRYKAFPHEELERLEVIAYRFLLHSAEYNDVAGLMEVWKKIPKHLQKNSSLLYSYVQLLIAKGANNEAEQILRTTLSTIWDNKLITVYGNILSSRPDQQLATAEKWLPAHKNNSVLLFVLGRLSVRNQLWGKARGYLEASLTIEPRQATYLELGRLLERLGEDPTNIIKLYKAGLQLGNHSSLALKQVVDIKHSA